MADPGPVWRRVLSLAERGRYSTSPNPRVGAVVVRPDGSTAGEGFHDRAGDLHAEAVALLAAGNGARGGTLYVNLEPCAHQGRTPPCADAIVAAGISRVRASIEDPDSRTRGRGFARLREGGVVVEVGGAAAEAARLNETFILSASRSRPFVHLKWASSLDGKSGAMGGDSKWITGGTAREDSLRLREECDAILVGSGTVRMDDPRLTRRLRLNRSILPHLRLVLDGGGDLAPEARVFDRDAPGVAWLVTSRPETDSTLDAFREKGVAVVPLPLVRRGFDLVALLRTLHDAEVRSVLVEGGGETAWTFVQASLADRVTAYVAPSLIGGREAPTPLAGDGFPDVSRPPRLEGVEVDRLGPDLKITGRVAYR